MVRSNAYVTAPEYQCHGKVGYSTKKFAKRVISRHKCSGGVRGLLSAYRCPHCGMFHIGKWQP